MISSNRSEAQWPASLVAKEFPFVIDESKISETVMIMDSQPLEEMLWAWEKQIPSHVVEKSQKLGFSVIKNRLQEVLWIYETPSGCTVSLSTSMGGTIEFHTPDLEFVGIPAIEIKGFAEALLDAVEPCDGDGLILSSHRADVFACCSALKELQKLFKSCQPREMFVAERAFA